MIRLFQTHDIVMFGEVHSSQQEYQWLCKLVQTPGFSDHVDDIVVEFGNALDQKTVDRYVAGEAVPFDEVQKAWRRHGGRRRTRLPGLWLALQGSARCQHADIPASAASGC